MQSQKTPFLAWSTTRWPTGKREALKNIQKPVRSSRALNHYTSLEDLSSLSSNSMVLFHPCSVSPHSQHSPLLYYRNKHHVLHWELRCRNWFWNQLFGCDSETEILSYRWASSNSETSFFLCLLLVSKMKLWMTLKWDMKGTLVHFLLYFFKLDRTCGLGDFVSVLIKWEDFPQMSLLKEYYTNLQKNKGLKRDHFLFLVSCISAIYFGILKTKLMTSAYRYYWLCTLSTLLVCSANNWCIRKI